MKVQAHSSLEPTMEYNQDQTSLTNQRVTEISHSFRLVIAKKTGNEISPSSRLEFLEKLLADNFSLSDAEDSTSWSKNRGGIANLTLLEQY